MADAYGYTRRPEDAITLTAHPDMNHADRLIFLEMILYTLTDHNKLNRAIYEHAVKSFELDIATVYSNHGTAEAGSLLPKSYESLVSTPYLNEDNQVRTNYLN